MNKLLLVLLITSGILLIGIFIFFLIRPCPEYYNAMPQISENVSSKIYFWYIEKFCPETKPVF